MIADMDPPNLCGMEVMITSDTLALSTRSQPEARPVCVVLDTNVWCSLKFLLLNTQTSEALLYALQRRRGRIGLPEVIERELEKNIMKVGIEALDRAVSANAVLHDIAQPGFLPLPDQGRLRAAIQERIQELDEMIVRVPFTPEHALKALDRVNSETPPNGPKNQQFKDSAIWEALLELGRTYEVYFVTADKGFFEGRNPKDGPARTLLAEVNAECRSLHIVHSDGADGVVATLQDGVPSLETNEIAALLIPHVLGHIRVRMKDRIRRHGGKIGRLLSHRLTPFRIQSADHRIIGFDFRYEYGPQSIDNPPNEAGSLNVAGTCRYNFHLGSISDVRITSDSISVPNYHEGSSYLLSFQDLTGAEQ